MFRSFWQVISTRVDLFPDAYTSKLASLQDSVEAMPFELVEAVRCKLSWEFPPFSSPFQ